MKKSFVLLILILSVMLVGCSSSEKKEKKANEDSLFQDFEFEDKKFQDIVFIEAEVREQILKNTDIKQIDYVEIEYITLNDVFVELAQNNFSSYYDSDIEWNKVMKDLAIGGVVIGLTLSLGPAGTYFGLVVASEYTAAAILISMALDAALSGVQAYNEGGDFSYIVGHIVMGIADGIKWGAILAPVTGGLSTIKYAKALKILDDLPGFKNVAKEAKGSIVHYLDEIVKYTSKLTKNSSDEVVEKAYKELVEKTGAKITKEIFKEVIGNERTLINALKKTDPFNVTNKAATVLRKTFLENSGLTGEAVESTLKKILNKTTKNLSELPTTLVENFRKNPDEFIELFGERISKELSESLMTELTDQTVSQTIKNVIEKSSKNHYLDLIKSLNKETVDNLLNNHAITKLIEFRYSQDILSKIYNQKNLFEHIKLNMVDDQTVIKIMDLIMEGSLKNLDDINKINKDAAKNIASNFEVFSRMLTRIEVNTINKDLINDILYNQMRLVVKDQFENNIIKDIMDNNLSKASIINKYGEDIYKELITKNHAVQAILIHQAKVNRRLISELTTDVLIEKGLSNSQIDQLFKGLSYKAIGLNDDVIFGLSNDLYYYYQATSTMKLNNFTKEIFGVVDQVFYEVNENQYLELVKRVSKSAADEVVSNGPLSKLFAARYDKEIVNTVYNQITIANYLKLHHKVDDADLISVIGKIMDGSLNSIDDIAKINERIALNLITSRDVILLVMKNMDITAQNTNLIDDLIVKNLKRHFRNDRFSEEMLKDIISCQLTKDEVISKYGNYVYQELVSKNQYMQEVLRYQVTYNDALIKDLTLDTLRKKINVSNADEIITNILNGESLSSTGLTDQVIVEIGNDVMRYLQTNDKAKLKKFIYEFSEIRAKTAKAFNEKNNFKTINSHLAGQSTKLSTFVLQEKYGEIMFNSAGFPIFDEFAIARLDLTGIIDGGLNDIPQANNIHHGANFRIPNYTWHHLEDGKTLILIPYDLHHEVKHTGGASLLRDGVFTTGGDLN
jgi:rubrerythrin